MPESSSTSLSDLLSEMRDLAGAEQDVGLFKNEDGSLNLDAIGRYTSRVRIIGGENGAGILVVPRGFHDLPGLSSEECTKAFTAYFTSEEYLAALREWCAPSRHLIPPPPSRPAPGLDLESSGPEAGPEPSGVMARLRRRLRR